MGAWYMGAWVHGTHGVHVAQGLTDRACMIFGLTAHGLWRSNGAMQDVLIRANVGAPAPAPAAISPLTQCSEARANSARAYGMRKGGIA